MLRRLHTRCASPGIWCPKPSALRSSCKSLFALLVTLVTLTLPTCQPARLDCRQEDPGCSDSALLVLFDLQATRAPLTVYWGDINTNNIYRLKAGSTQPETVVNLGTSPLRLAFTSDGQTLYATDASTVYSVSIETGSSVQISNMFADIYSLVVVEKEGKIYYSDNGSGQVDTTDLDGSNYANVHGPASPLGMDIDEINDFQYIANSGQIVRYNMDGSGPTAVVPSISAGVEDIELDNGGQKLFWLDRVSGELRSIKTDGNNETLLVSSIGSGRGVAFHPSSPYLYYCDAGIQSIVRVSLDGSSPLNVASGMNCRDVDFAPVSL